MKLFSTAAWAALAAAIATPAAAELQDYSVIVGTTRVGHLKADVQGDRATIDYDFKNNGRGPTMKETIRFGAEGLPVAWDVTGTTTFGSKVDERFAREGAKATWTDSTGKGSAPAKGVYVTQSGSPWATGLYARAIMKAGGNSIAALPGGTLRLTKGETLSVAGSGGPLQITRYDISGIETSPDSVLLDPQGNMFAVVSPNFAIIRAGYEAEADRLKELAAKWSTDRFVDIQKKVAHRYAGPVRIRNVRVFDPKTQALTGPVAVVVNGRRIAAVEPLGSPATKGETVVDGAGGTLIPGLYEMHAHTSQEGALLNLMAGVTSMRDMGNNNEVLAALIERIESGTIAGPRITRTGFIEGKSPFSSNNGMLVNSQEEAIDAARWYAARDFWAIKSYNSMNPAWVPAMVAEAKKLGLKVLGHVPAFTNADAMIGAGFDELTHINQLMLGWVIQPTEDTRTLFRLTALKRLPGLDLNSPRVQHTVNLMVERKVPIDVTLGIHENLLTNRNGAVARGAADYFEHMPIGTQRSLKQAWIDTSAPGDDAAYRGAYDKIVQTIRMLHDRGVMIVPGTDTGGSFTYHRELELYQDIGMTPAQILKRATWDMAAYLGQDQQLGSIEKGKFADFFLVPGDPTKELKAIKRIAMVVKDGAFYYPAEVYPEFGIKPFAPAPKVVAAAATK
ncbi:amidohydrolase family protein [Sphingomonas sp.]|jgi:imidazolonepropionase-like amidohydrolase|uniref:amidohydrolase family protein n=1 Tax=Sphingomonas sp. TaxID=28214 RepID=UPI002DEB147D|nr:amidohydrolase family protein [Sphingomonas sp.]HEV2568989.1 amidohydrolase family protein [Sphingomonas sp.]